MHMWGQVTHMVEEKGVLVSIGVHGPVPWHSFQATRPGRRQCLSVYYEVSGIWERRTRGWARQLLHTTKVHWANQETPAYRFPSAGLFLEAWTCHRGQVIILALTSALSFLSVGLVHGTVLLYHHLVQSLVIICFPPETSSHARNHYGPTMFLAFTTAHASVSMDPMLSPIADPSPALALNSPPPLSLVVVATSSTYVYPILQKLLSLTAVLVEETGVGWCCMCVHWKSHWVVLGRAEAIVGIGSGSRLAVVSYKGQLWHFGLKTICLTNILRAPALLAQTLELCSYKSYMLTNLWMQSIPPYSQHLCQASRWVTLPKWMCSSTARGGLSEPSHSIAKWLPPNQTLLVIAMLFSTIHKRNHAVVDWSMYHFWIVFFFRKHSIRSIGHVSSFVIISHCSPC